jgi:hypothetical protein
MSLDDKVPVEVYLTKKTDSALRQLISQRWGTYNEEFLSMEVKRAVLSHIKRWSAIPGFMDTHTFSQLNGLKVRDISIFTRSKDSESETTTAIMTKVGGEKEEYHKRPIEEDPILVEWLLKQGIDITNAESVASHITKEDIRVGELANLELQQWKKDQHNKLIMKRRRIHNGNWYSIVSKRDKAMEPELSLIKQHLVNTNSIREQNKIHVEQIYKAWVVVTSKRDYRPFKNRLHEYTDGGYLTPLDEKHKIFRAEDKFLTL